MPDLGEEYDWTEVDSRSASRSSTPGRPSRRGTGAVVLAAALWAIDDIALGEKKREPVVEEAEVPGPDPSARVVVHLVPGKPRASWARVIVG